MRRLLARPEARLLFAGETLSMFGDRAMFMALGIWAKALTGSNAAAGLVFFVIALPSLAAPLGGWVVDRVRRRTLMIGIDLAIGSAMLLLLLVHDRGRLWLIYLVAGLYGASSLVFASAQSALLTVLLPEELLVEANALFQSVREGLRLIAPLAGAGLYAAFGGGSVAVLEAATFGASALCLSLLRVREPRPHPSEHRFVTEVVAGVRHVWRTLPLRQIVFAAAAAFLVIGFAETVIFAVIDQGLHRPPSFFGVLGALQGVGAIAGGVSAPRVLRRLGDVRLVGLGIGLFAAGDACFVAHSLAVVAIGIAVAGAGLSWAIVGFATAIQLRSPGELQGRVYSAADTVVGTPQTLSIALGAALSTVVDYRVLVLAMAIAVAACSAYLLTRRETGGLAVAAPPRPVPAVLPVDPPTER